MKNRICGPIIMLLCLCGVSSHAATFYVNTEEDLPDRKPGDGVAMALDGKTTFRVAIEEANALAGEDTIIFTAYAVEEANSEIAWVYGPLFINDDLIVRRIPGREFQVSCRFGGMEPYRAIEVGPDVRAEFGEGIDFSTYGSAAQADRGGFMYMHPGSEVHLGYTTGKLGSATISGGAIYVDHATLYMADSCYGTTTGDGGGVYNDHGVVYGSASGTALRGGGIYNDHGVVVAYGLSPRRVVESGGGIHSEGGYVFVNGDPSISGGTAKFGGMAYLADDAVLEIWNSGIINSTATNDGAAIYIESGTLRATQCHFSQGTAGRSGGAIYVASGEAILLNCAFVDNAAASTEWGVGGAIAVAPGAVCRMGNTAIAGNTAFTGEPGADIWGEFVSLGHNAIGIADGGSGLLPSDLTGTLASPLDLGWTLFHFLPERPSWPRDVYLPQAGSILIDAGDATLLAHPDFIGNACFDLSGSGFPRVRNTAVDIGCFEMQEGPTLESCIGIHRGDTDKDEAIGLTELLRVIQLYNGHDYHCDVTGEDTFAPGPGDHACTPHDSDYNPQDWRVSLSELLRLIQFYNFAGYHPCDEGEDGFCPGE